MVARFAALLLPMAAVASAGHDSSRVSASQAAGRPPFAAILQFGPTILKNELPERAPVLTDAERADKRKHKDQTHLISFYGNDCEMCEYMVPFIRRCEKECNLKIRRFETWSHPEHEKLRALCDSRAGCGGVPFFYNKETRRWICGATTYDNLKRWATGKPCAPFLPPPTSFKAQEAPREPSGPFKVLSDIKERGKEAMEERQRLAEEQRKMQDK